MFDGFLALAWVSFFTFIAYRGVRFGVDYFKGVIRNDF